MIVKHESGFIADEAGFEFALIKPAEERGNFRVHSRSFAEENGDAAAKAFGEITAQ